MPFVIEQLALSRCPHCRVDQPSLNQIGVWESNNYTGSNRRFWRAYNCQRCGGVVTAGSDRDRGEVKEIYPESIAIDEAIPNRARVFLQQAIDTVHAPSGSIMLSASSVDAMLKANGYTSGSLYSRIDKAKDDHLITEKMAEWAHAVRLDANAERHADENADLPTSDDAKRCIDFVMALGQLLFVLPSRIEKGLALATPPPSSPTTTT